MNPFGLSRELAERSKASSGKVKRFDRLTANGNGFNGTHN